MELKPCPYCGGVGEVSWDVESGDPCIECSWCNSQGPRTRTREDAAEEWNKRIEAWNKREERGDE